MSNPSQNPVPKLVCRGLWKLFGPRDAEAMRRLTPAASDADFAAAGMVPAVRGIDISVNSGDIFVIMGLSGSGKSTLVRCLSRLIEPSAGEILFDGTDLLHAKPAEMARIRRDRMGMVFQNFALLPHLTVLQNVAFPLEIQKLPRAQREARALEMIRLVGLAGREHSYPRELSGGQQQRVGIARSLAGDPELWFLDEPFSALDPLIRREMQDEFLRLQAVLKKTIVFITHDFDEAIRLADRIAIMQDGRIEQQGRPAELVLNPATPYVREFTGAVPKAKVVRVADLAKPVAQSGMAADQSLPKVPAKASIAEAAPLFQRGAAAALVEDAAGQVSGILHREDVIDLMLAG